MTIKSVGVGVTLATDKLRNSATGLAATFRYKERFMVRPRECLDPELTAESKMRRMRDEMYTLRMDSNLSESGTL